MGSVKKAVKKVERFTKKKIIKPIDNAIVEPLEKPVKSAVKAVIVKPVTAVAKVADEAFEEIIEKPVKKVATETFDVVTGGDKTDRRPPPEPEVTPEVTPEVVPDETILASKGRRRTKGKRSGAGGTLMEGFGVAYAKPSSKSATGGSS